MSYNFERMCPKVTRHIQENGGAFDLDWLEKHVTGCNQCKSLMRLVNGTIIADIKREIGNDDEPDKLQEN